MDLVIHIGYHKTATTGLQKFLTLNRSRLLEQDVHYIGDCENHYMYSVLYHKQDYYDQKCPREALPIRKALFRALENKRYKTLLLSSEGFCESPLVPKLLFRDLEPFVKEGVRVIILVYLRRQDQWIQSAYQQQVKQDNCRLAETLEGFYETSMKFVDYAERLKLWEKYFGLESIRVKLFEPARFEKDIFHDFSDAVGFQIQEGFEFPDRSKSNIGINLDLLEMIRISNELGLSQIMHSRLRAAEKKLPAHKGTSGAFSLIPAAKRQTILQRFRESNEVVARRYLGREDGILFSDMTVDPSLDKTHTLTLEGMASVLLTLFDDSGEY